MKRRRHHHSTAEAGIFDIKLSEVWMNISQAKFMERNPYITPQWTSIFIFVVTAAVRRKWASAAEKIQRGQCCTFIHIHYFGTRDSGLFSFRNELRRVDLTFCTPVIKLHKNY